MRVEPTKINCYPLKQGKQEGMKRKHLRLLNTYINQRQITNVSVLPWEMSMRVVIISH